MVPRRALLKALEVRHNRCVRHYLKSTAKISDCGCYRYLLHRSWGKGPHFVFCGLNPSTADAHHDDMTVRKCVGFTQRIGGGSISIVNLFAFRATRPLELVATQDPIGPENDAEILGAVQALPVFVCAWGGTSGVVSRLVQERLEVVGPLLAGLELWCLGVTKDGSPCHPSRLAYAREIMPFGL